MPVIKLDRSRDFATVHGEGMTHAFEQDGIPFDHQGVLVAGLVPDHKKDLVERKLKRLARLEEPMGPTDDESDEGGDAVADGSDMNFEAWLKDEVRYPQHEVFKEAKKRFSKVFTNYRDLAEFLVFDENICSRDQVPTKLGPMES